MKRRVCETCLYFEPSGLSNNGWCHHPARRQNSDMRLMVRANELACRNGWNADLWVSADDDIAAQTAEPRDAIAPRAQREVAPAEQNDLIKSIVAARSENLSLDREHPKPTATDEPVAQAQVADSRPLQEDIFVEQTPSRSWRPQPPADVPATSLVQDPRAAILRARDQYRERRKNEGRLADRERPAPVAPLVASSREAHRVDDLDLSETENPIDAVDARYENRPLLRPHREEPVDDQRPVSPVSLDEIERRFPVMTEFPEDRDRFESVPDFQHTDERVRAEEQVQDDTWIETRQLDPIQPEPYEVDDYFEEDELAATTIVDDYEDEELSLHHRESFVDRFFRNRRHRHHSEREPAPVHIQPPIEHNIPMPNTRRFDDEVVAEPNTNQWEPEPYFDNDRVDVDHHAHQSRVWEQPRARPRIPENRALEPGQPARLIESSRDLDDDFVLPPPLPVYEPPQQTEPQQTNRVRPYARPERLDLPHPIPRQRYETPTADDFGDQPLFAEQPSPPHRDDYADSRGGVYPPSSSRTPEVERICRTCRDFRPTGDGDRGWCTNKWAFSHRRMVDADDLACRNSLGSWWTPRDDVWRRDGDISRHAQDTPRVDQWLFGTDEEERRRSGS